MLKNVYSVSQVNRYIKDMFAQDFMLKKISVKGEVSNCKYHSSGHIYFSIKDQGTAIRAIMFAGNRSGLTFPMKDGDQVVVTGSVEVYERDGQYQIYARQIEQDGEGNLYLKFEQLKSELEEMGMFSQEYKQPIPTYAKTVGIVTAATGAAVQDIRNVATRRNPYVQLILYPALVQGEGAAASVVNGIHAMEQLGVDVIIVGRGGGSIEDLWAFNEEIVARAIFDCSIPIISAVGHETDWTIADFVSDLRAPTPSAAAELAVFDVRNVQMRLQQSQYRMNQLMDQKLQMAREKLAHAKTRLRFMSPQNRLNDNRKYVADIQQKLTLAMEKVLDKKKQQMMLLTNALEYNSPLKKLSQGYAFIEQQEHKPIRTIDAVAKEDTIYVQMLDGSITAMVTEVTKRE